MKNIEFIHETSFSSEIKEFYQSEWPSANQEVFGFTEQARWKMEEYSITARENKDILGIAQFRIIGGVGYLSTLLVKEEYRGKGVIGKELLLKFESITKKKDCHKLSLKSYVNSRASSFFLKHGYSIEGTLSKDIHGIDWEMMAKFL